MHEHQHLDVLPALRECLRGVCGRVPESVSVESVGDPPDSAPRPLRTALRQLGIRKTPLRTARNRFRSSRLIPMYMHKKRMSAFGAFGAAEAARDPQNTNTAHDRSKPHLETHVLIQHNFIPNKVQCVSCDHPHLRHEMARRWQLHEASSNYPKQNSVSSDRYVPRCDATGKFQGGVCVCVCDVQFALRLNA